VIDGRQVPLNRGHRIVELRNLLVLTQKELASVIGIAQSYLSDLERGRVELTPAAIHRICAATATPTSFFQYSTPPYTADDINFRTHTRNVSAKQQDFVIQAFKEIERISAMLAQAPVVRVKRVGIPFAEHADLSDHDLELLAGDIRAAYGLSGDAPVPNVTRMMEQAGIAIASISAPFGNDRLLEGHCGMSRWPAGSPRASVGLVTGMTGDRQRFTLAHEFGHVVLHSRRSVSDPKQRQREAEYFAGALLLPRPYAQHTITESLTLHDYLRIKAEFGISIQAIITRAQRLGLITWNRQHSLTLQLSTRGWRHNEPVHVDPESPLLLHSELVALHGAHPYPAASSALGISPALLQSWIPEPNNDSGRKDSEVTPMQRLRL
jgi:Zn-dependent peptidase ImmA (M78 family)/transcriptional regulator with XRE-family HTH domain